MKFIHISIIISIALSLTSCVHDHSADDGHNHGIKSDQHIGHNHGQPSTEAMNADYHQEDGKIHLTREQINTMDIQFGDFSQIKINDFVAATGTLGLPPNALTSVSAKANGFIKNSNKYVEGSYVKKGVIMAYLENPEFIQLQREYLEVKAALLYLKQELTRQKTLLQANAGIEKNVQKLESEMAIKMATSKGLAKQLAYLGINVKEVTGDNIVQRVPIYSPMTGYITSIKMHNGMYVSPELELMEIVNEKHLHLELDIFEKDIANIKEEQAISYMVPALGNTIYQGEVHVIGKEFNTENKTVRIHGHLEAKRPKFIKDLFVEAKIWLNDQTVQALPEQSVIKDGTSSYIFVSNKKIVGDGLEFEKIMVIPSLTDKGFTAVKTIDPIPTNMKVVTKGAYYVYAQSKAGSLEHNH